MPMPNGTSCRAGAFPSEGATIRLVSVARLEQEDEQSPNRRDRCSWMVSSSGACVAEGRRGLTDYRRPLGLSIDTTGEESSKPGFSGTWP